MYIFLCKVTNGKCCNGVGGMIDGVCGNDVCGMINGYDVGYTCKQKVNLQQNIEKWTKNTFLC